MSRPPSKPSENNFEQAKNYFLLGLESFQKELFEDAERYLFLSLNILPDRLSTLTNLSTVLIKLDKLEKANEIISRAIELFPSDEIVYLNQGLLFGKNKKWEMALLSCEKAIELKDDYAEAYLNRGVVLQELKRLEQSLASYDKAIELENDFKDAKINREIVLQQLYVSQEILQKGAAAAQAKNYVDAIKLLSKALEIDNSNIYAYNYLGNVFLELNKLDEGLINFNKAIELNENFAEAYYNRGNLFKKFNLLDKALISYDEAIKLKHDYVEAYINRGTVLKKFQHFELALVNFNIAIEIRPDFAEAYSNRGNVLHSLKKFDEAIVNYNKAIELKPDFADAYSNCGLVLNELKCYEEALASCDKAIELKPDFAYAYSNRGLVLNELKCYEEALASYDKAIELKSDYAKAYSNRGVVLNELMRFEESLASYDKAIELKSDYAKAYFNKSTLLLSLQDFENGWELYEWRWKRENLTSRKRNFSQPLWLGVESLANKTILLHAEQGLGDTIQFCRYIPLVKKLGARVLLEVPKPLMELLEDFEGVDELLEAGKKLPEFDYQCPLLSLPLSFKTELNSIPSPTPYLQSNAEKIMVWSQRLGAKSKHRIGLVWSGSTIHKNDSNRSLALADLINYLPQNFEYVSLQKEVRERDNEVLANSAIKNYSQQLIDFTDTAALCDLMDLVISVDTSVAHLAAALGKPTWILLPFISDWRWLLDRDDSPWYESVKLYRQGEDRQWEPVLERVARDLTELNK